MAKSPQTKSEVLTAYDIHWFTKRDKANEFRCDLCRNVFADPQQIVVCGHRFCRTCLPSPLRRCPVCNKDVKENEVFSDESAKQKVLDLQIKCPHKGCPWKGKVRTLNKTHVKECPLQIVQCTNPDCHKTLCKEALEKHLTEECEYREIECLHCSKKIFAGNEKAHHDSECSLIPTECPLSCKNVLPKEEIQRHVDNECEKSLIDCKYKTVGCQEKVERAKMPEHEQTALQDHLFLSTTTIDKMKEEKRQMAEQIKELKHLNENFKSQLQDLEEKQEKSVEKIDARLTNFEKEGTLKLEAAQKAAEQNYESVAEVVQQNGELQEVVSMIENLVNTLRTTTISNIQSQCVRNHDSIQKLRENWNKQQTMIVAIHKKFSSALGSLQDNMDHKYENLCKQQEHDHARMAKFEKEVNEEFAQLHRGVQENGKKLEKQKMSLSSTKDEMDAELRQHAEQMQLDYDTLDDKIKKETRKHDNNFLELSEKIQNIKFCCEGFGSLVWRIENVNLNSHEVLEGKSFYTQPYGYVIRPKLFLNGAWPKDKGYISVFIQLLPGPYDAVLSWPFNKRIRFTLIEQSTNHERGIRRELRPKTDADELRRPTDEANNGYGIYKFASHAAVRAGNYVVDKIMFLKVDVLENIQDDGLSQTI